jgi:hypothetical protein
MTEPKKTYTAEDNVRSIRFDMKILVEETKKISDYLMVISTHLRAENIMENSPDKGLPF